MAWKQDLAKLKQQLGPEAATPAAKPLPKPPLRPEGPVPLADEDAIFLSAMGLKPAAHRSANPVTAPMPTESPVAIEQPVPDTFQDALKDLKGLKPLQTGIQHQQASAAATTESPKPLARPAAGLAATPAAPVEPSAPSSSAPDPVPLEPSIPEPVPVTPAPRPTRFQLAAGMAIEVDGSLDLRGHSLTDALERLKDRLGDGMLLGWRSLQVNLGTDPALHEGLLALLASGEVPMVARFAQAPVPMGGTQAWLLYFGSPQAQP